MSTASAETSSPTQLDDLSAYLIAGRVSSHAPEDRRTDTEVRTVREGITDGEEAENLGFRNVFFSERWNLKEAAVFLGAVGARTERVGLATGLVSPARRHLLHMAAFGATMHAAFGPRFILGLGRGDHAYLRHEGLRTAGFDGICDYVDILRQLWRGDKVTYDGPAGRYDGIKLGDVYEGPDPQVWYGTFGLPRAAAAVARSFDGVILPPMMTPEATERSVGRLRQACERIDRDPASLHIVQCVVTAPDLDDEETRTLAHARAVTYLQAPQYGDALTSVNGWDAEPVQKLRAALEESRRQAGDELVDTAFHRRELLKPARLVPDSWMEDSCAFGSASECVAALRSYREAGADEIATYGSTPGQNAAVAHLWTQKVMQPA
ncbi:TIGR03857 family LLM class F420-dependent oxidoreductase [Gordonia westfalica]|uniref:TIGR03857 family LLM class F420-dependent oxidoreductase n=1 Tax=Gordonia westfalica TaxID=158898 RepID=A0ABU2GV54_9ACTN|nr:TIGR03857 family LLM class F420-dependent oxidoreductase [Gordonia westfalica]MDS1114829.1 TIGR03857 family LLM class F420-dependent oxidoreductase [Gordonia westfalica]